MRPFAFFQSKQNGPATPYSASRVHQRLHRYSGGEGAVEFLERRKGETEGHKKWRARL